VPDQAAANSLQGFALAAALGAGMIETDLRLSADGALVLAHDDDLALPGQARVSVAGTPLARLRQWGQGGEPPATLDEALSLRHHGAALTFNLDIKVRGTAALLMAALRRAGRREGILLTGTAPCTFRAVQAELPWVQAALTGPGWLRAVGALSPALGGGALGVGLVAAARLMGVGALALEHTVATREAVQACHDAGLQVLVWTVDRPPRMRDMLAIGVDGITTNRVAALMRLAGESTWSSGGEARRAERHRRP
jgi:glycerophosphoryl diester phosphodiesterase